MLIAAVILAAFGIVFGVRAAAKLVLSLAALAVLGIAGLLVYGAVEERAERAANKCGAFIDDKFVPGPCKSQWKVNGVPVGEDPPPVKDPVVWIDPKGEWIDPKATPCGVDLSDIPCAPGFKCPPPEPVKPCPPGK